jgi:NTE family protein
MREHWQSGLEDIQASLAQPGWLDMPDNDSGFVTHDIHRDAR